MKNYSLIKLFMLNLYISIGVLVFALVGTGAGLASTLSVTAVLDGWHNMLYETPEGMEAIRLVFYFILLLSLPFSQAMISDKDVAKFKKMMGSISND